MTIGTLGAVLGRGWNWWRAGLRDALPPAIRRGFRDRAGRLECRMHGGRLTSVRQLRGDGRVVWERPFDAASRGDREPLDALLRRYRAERATVTLKVEPADVLVKEFYLPNATAENLDEVLTFEMDRQTPFTAADVYYGHRVLQRDAPGRRIQLRLLVVARARVEAALAALAVLGIRVAEISCDLDGRPETIARLAAPVAAAGRERMRAIGLALGTVLVVVLALAVVAVPATLRQRVLEDLQAESRASRQQLRLMAAPAGRRVSAQRAQFIVTQQMARPPAMVILKELTDRAPDTTVLTQIALEGAQLKIYGESDNASAVIDALEESKYFQGGALHLTTPRGIVSKVDWFEITLGVVNDAR